jgi:tRNA (guanine-N7-)-methyltransferase
MTPPTSARPLQPWFQTLDDLPPTLDWATLFPASGPVEVDIGSGRGLFVLTAALRHPQTNFVGLEIDYTEGRRAAERLQKRNLPNARILGGDAVRALSVMIPPGSIHAAHVYFPDPWWKTRHHKRRIFNPQFTELLARVVQPGGFVHHWTDVADYFHMATAFMNASPCFIPGVPPEERQAEHDMDYQTSFERKKRRLGFPIYRALWERR